METSPPRPFGSLQWFGKYILQTEMHFPNLRGLPLLKNELPASILINVDLKETRHSNLCAGVIYCKVLRGAEQVVLGLYNQTHSLPPSHRASPQRQKGKEVVLLLSKHKTRMCCACQALQRHREISGVCDPKWRCSFSR